MYSPRPEPANAGDQLAEGGSVVNTFASLGFRIGDGFGTATAAETSTIGAISGVASGVFGAIFGLIISFMQNLRTARPADSA